MRERVMLRLPGNVHRYLDSTFPELFNSGTNVSLPLLLVPTRRNSAVKEPICDDINVPPFCGLAGGMVNYIIKSTASSVTDLHDRPLFVHLRKRGE